MREYGDRSDGGGGGGGGWGGEVGGRRGACGKGVWPYNVLEAHHSIEPHAACEMNNA